MLAEEAPPSTLHSPLWMSDTACSAVFANFGYTVDTPLFKKYAVMNSGLLNATRYNETIINSLGTIKVRPAL